jgi:hypothetical protein
MDKRLASLTLPSVKYLRQCFIYEESTGKLWWKKRPRSHFPSNKEFRRWNKVWSGREAFTCTNKGGYKIGAIEGVTYIASRLIWKLMTGRDPVNFIDHKDRNKTNNKWGNLREATCSQNFINRMGTIGASGVIGIRINKQKTWHARIHKDKKYIHLGTFPTKDLAIAARRKAERELFGEFAP